jgi:hypothetical protein
MARSAARKASPGEAARTVERPKRASAKRGPGSAGDRAARTVARAQAAFRAAEEDAARRGAEVEPAVPSERPGADDPAAQTRERPSLHLLSEVAEAEPAASEPPYEPSVDVSDAESAIGEAPPPPLGLAVADLARSALGLVRTLVGVPFRIALAIPRLALRAIASV